jgi:hypothetical protein
MASLIDTYGTALGVIPKEKPQLNEHFIPLPDKKYIVIHNDNKLQSKYYEYFPEVISLLRPILHNAGYKIYQIGGPNDPPLDVDRRMNGISWNQNFFVIEHASLFIGIDSVNAHTAAAYDAPSIVLFSHIYPEQAITSWSDKRVILQPEWGNKKPSYMPQETPKMIRTIKVEKIVQAAFRLLGLNKILDMTTIRVGDDYHEPVMEIVPDFFINNPALKNGTLHMRMDLNFNEKCLCAWLSHGFKANILTDRPISLDILRHFKDSIARVTLMARTPNDYDINYVNSVKNIGLDVLIVATEEEGLPVMREKFFNYIVESIDQPDRSIVDKIPKNSKFLTKKQVHSQGKIYPSIAHWRAQKVCSPQNKIIESPEFWQDIEYFFFYK